MALKQNPDSQMTQRINECIKEFLRFNGYSSTLECLEAEERMVQINSQGKSIKKTKFISNPYGKQEDDTPKIFKLFENEGQVN